MQFGEGPQRSISVSEQLRASVERLQGVAECVDPSEIRTALDSAKAAMSVSPKSSSDRCDEQIVNLELMFRLVHLVHLVHQPRRLNQGRGGAALPHLVARPMLSWTLCAARSVLTGASPRPRRFLSGSPLDTDGAAAVHAPGCSQRARRLVQSLQQRLQRDRSLRMADALRLSRLLRARVERLWDLMLAESDRLAAAQQQHGGGGGGGGGQPPAPRAVGSTGTVSLAAYIPMHMRLAKLLYGGGGTEVRSGRAYQGGSFPAFLAGRRGDFGWQLPACD
eukprot:COSAG01_NODE_4993_length_4560_cov_31.921991_1_plen_277_part_10